MGTGSSDREARRAMLISMSSHDSENKDPSIEQREKGGTCLRQLLEEEVADSAGDVGSLSFCYKIIKSMLIGGSFDDSSASRLNSADAFGCCLALHEQCRKLSREQGGSVAVGSLLAAGIALSSFVSIQCDKERMNEYLGKFLRCVQGEFQRRDNCAAWEQYGATLCRTLNKMALALLKDGNSDESFQVCTEGILCVVKYVPDAILKTLKSLVALSQHLVDKSQQIGLMVECMEIWMKIETIEDDSVVDQCLSCARRALPEVESWGWCDEGKAVQTMLMCVQVLYSRCCDKDPHAGVAAIGAVAKYVSIQKGGCDLRGVGVLKSLNEALDAILGSSTAVKESRFKQPEQLKELRWLSVVLYKCVGEGREQDADSVFVSLLSASLQCHMKLLVCDESSRHRISGEIRQRSELHWAIIGQEDMLIKVVHCLWLNEMTTETSKLLARLVRDGVESRANKSFSPSAFLCSAFDASKKNKWGMDIVQSVAKACVVCLGMVGELCPEYAESLQPEAVALVSKLHDIFNPGKNADGYLDVMMSCHMYSHVFSSVFSVDQFALDVNVIRDRTKTKIGHKRISDILGVIEAIKVERRILDMMKESLKSHEEEAEHRKRMLQKDPSLVHSDEWKNKESHQVSMVISDKAKWDDLVSEAKIALNTCQDITTLQSSGVVLAQLEQFIAVHNLEEIVSNIFWKSLMEVSAFDEKDAKNCLEDLKKAMKMPDQNALSLSHLNFSLSRYQATHGHLRSAIFHAMEAYKHVNGLVNPFPTESAGSWCTVMMQYVACTSWLGFLFAGSGLFEESIQSYTEGLKMSCLLGSPIAAMYFSVNLAEVFLNSGDSSRFQLKVRESVELLNCVPGGHDSGPAGYVSAHLYALLGHVDRKNLEFGLAQQKLDRCEKILDTLSDHLWYRYRVMATSAYQRILAILDEDSSMVPEDIDSFIQKIEAQPELLLGVPYHQMLIVKAQLLSQKFMKSRESSRATIWVSQPICEDGTMETMESLRSIACRLKHVPFCQKIVFKLMAPMFALFGCKFTAISLLHSASNPTLNFQFDLVGHTKRASRDLKSGSLTLENNDDCEISGIMEEFGSVFGDASCDLDLDAIELRAENLVTSWTKSLPNVVICGVSVYDRHVYGFSDNFNDTIILYRLKKDQVPIMVQIPSPEVESSHPIHSLHGIKSCGAVQLMREKLEDILKRSNENMRSISLDCSEAEQRSWWMQRVELDDAMQGMLSNLHADWIGPWRCLFGDVDNLVTKVESSLLHALFSKEKTMLSEAEIETLSAAVEISFHDVDGSMLSKTFSEMHLHEKEDFARRSLGKSVSFKLDTKNDEAYLMPSSPERASVMRSEPENDVMERLSSINIIDDSERSIPNTPARGLDPSHPPGASGAKSVMRKHKSRLVQMHALGTPGPRKILGSMNNASGNFETPRTSAKSEPKVGSLLDRVKTMPPVRKSRSREDEDGPSTTPDTPVVLTLDHSIQCLPWESSFRLLTGKTTREFYRIPSLPSFAATRGRKNKIQTNSCFYTLNPSGDLISTQNVFENWFRGMEGWSGKAGCPPQVSELANALQSKDLFIYCGHGGGEQYIPLSRLRSLDSCSLSLLMGCSSGKLKWSTESQYDATGVVLAYTLAGCPAVVGNLWDVTDKDIDRYCQEMLTKMLSSKTMSIGQLVQFSRQACKLPYLIGAAPICYGIPVQFD